MFGSEILDVALGMTFIYLLLSLVSSAVREGAESFVRARAVHLERGIRLMLDDPDGTGLSRDVYQHPLVYTLFRGEYVAQKDRRFGGNLPNYIPSRAFASAVIDLLARGTTHGPLSVYPTPANTNVDQLRFGIDHVDSPQVRRMLTMALDGAGGDIERVRDRVEQWFNDTMDRVSGWYRRRTAYGLFAIATVVAVSLNIDSLAIVDHLWRNEAARAALVARAEAFGRDENTARMVAAGGAASEELLRRQLRELDQLSLPIGWSSANVTGPLRALSKFFGLLITVFAISLGAPFWFDALKRVMVIRSTVKPASTTADQRGETPQGSAPPPAATIQPATSSAVVVAEIPASRMPSGVVVVPAAPAFEGHKWATGEPEEEGLL